MQINETSILITIILTSLIILPLHFLRNRIFNKGNGVYLFLALVVLILLRMIVPVELPPMEGLKVVSIYHPIMFLIHEELFGDVSAADILIWTWLIVAVFLVARFIITYIRFISGLRKSAFSDQKLEYYWSDVIGDKNKDGISIMRNRNIDTPISVGIIHKMIMIPDHIGSDDIDLIIRHEFEHIKSGDLLIKFCINILCCVFWFNPLFYWLRKDIGQTLEIRCDRKVTSDMDDLEKARYLEMLLAVFKGIKKQSFLDVNAVHFAGDMAACNIKERFTAVGSNGGRKKCTSAQISVFIVCLLLLFGSYLFSSKQYRAAANVLWEMEKLPDIVTPGLDQKLYLLNVRMQQFDIDGDAICPVTGIAGMDATGIPEEERHKIIDVPEEYRQMMFDVTKDEFI